MSNQQSLPNWSPPGCRGSSSPPRRGKCPPKSCPGTATKSRRAATCLGHERDYWGKQRTPRVEFKGSLKGPPFRIRLSCRSHGAWCRKLVWAPLSFQKRPGVQKRSGHPFQKGPISGFSTEVIHFAYPVGNQRNHPSCTRGTFGLPTFSANWNQLANMKSNKYQCINKSLLPCFKSLEQKKKKQLSSCRYAWAQVCCLLSVSGSHPPGTTSQFQVCYPPPSDLFV